MVCAVFFDINILEKRKIRFDHVFAPGNIDFFSDDLKQVGDLRAVGEAEMLDPSGAREIRVRGDVQGEMEVCCARCLSPTRVGVSSALDLYYRPMSEIARNEEEVAISEAETEIGFYEGGGLELADVIREQIMIQLPMRSICREDCKGICPICGGNRNFEDCRCQEHFSDPRWEALRKWKF